MIFGLAGRDGANSLMAVAQFPDGKTPYAARLVLRDATTTQGPYLDTRGQPLASTGASAIQAQEVCERIRQKSQELFS